MRDRQPTPGREGRVKIVGPYGDVVAGTLQMDDDPLDEGTPFNKSTMLKDATAALYGLGVDAVPDDVFAFLGKYAQHWWRRRAFTYVPVLAAAEEVSIIQTGGQSSALDVPYSSELSITSLTEFDLKSPTNLSLSYNTYEQGNTLKGKYFRTHIKFGGEVISEDIFYMAPDASNVWRDSGTGYFVNGMAAKVSIATQYGEDYEYVKSSDRHTYPDSGEQDGYEYEYLGIPFDNAVGTPEVEIGSYVGTGTYGSSNPNTLTFGFVPKFLLISLDTENISTQAATHGFWYAGINHLLYFLDTGVVIRRTATLSGTTLSWFSNSNDSSGQLNVTGETYHYIAFG